MDDIQPPPEVEALVTLPPSPQPVLPSVDVDDHPPGHKLRSVVGAKLATSMFLHHFTQGAWMVTLGSYVRANTAPDGAAIFAAGFVGTIYGAGPLGGMISPAITGMLADRFFATERMMAVLNTLGAVMLLLAVSAETQWGFYLAVLSYFVVFAPSFALAASLTFHHLEEPQKSFPIVRACGTAGWVTGGVFVGWFWPWLTGEVIEPTATPMKIAACSELLTAAFCLLLPHTPPIARKPGHDAAGLKSSDLLALLRHPPFVLLLLLAAMAHMPSQFYYAYGNVFFNWTGMTAVAAKMTLGQVVEIACITFLPVLLLRVNVKYAILAGLAIWCSRFFILSAAATASEMQTALIYGVILVHGLAFSLTSISLQLEVDLLAGRRRRATAQGLLSIAMQGIGCFIGAELAGLAGRVWLQPADTGDAAAGWAAFWHVPAWTMLAVLVFAAITLPRDRSEHT